MSSLEQGVLVVFLDEDWDCPPVGFTRRQMLLALGKHLASLGSSMLCLDRPICPFTTPASNPQKLLASIKGHRGLRQVAEGLYLFTPWFFLHERLATEVSPAAWLNRVVLQRQIEACLKWLQMRDRQRISLIFHPYQKDMLGVANEKLSIYECYDEYAPKDLRTFLLNPRPHAASLIRRNEQDILKKVDIIVTTSEELLQKCLALNPRTYLLHNGVDYERFAQDNLRPPEDAGRFAHPVIGFAGTAKQVVDFGLVAACARLRPQWSFVFLGPQDQSPAFQAWLPFQEARKQPNVYFWGVKPEEDVPRHMAQFDVATIPYLTGGDCTTAIYPLKINEYLASGRPVVSTNYLRDFAEYRDVVYLSADTPEEFCRTIEQALAQPDLARIARGKAIAKSNSWSNRAERLCAIIEARLSA